MKMNVTGLKTDTLAELVKRVLQISKKDVYAMVKNHPLLLKMAECFEDYMDVFDKKTYSGKGELVLKADLLRDSCYLGIKDIVMGNMQIEGLSTRLDATDLYAIMVTHGVNLYRYTYGDESSHLEQLIADFEKPENTVRLAHLQLTEGFGLLKTAQQNFQVIFNEQSSANAELRGKESVSSLQANLTAALRTYLDYVDVMNSFDSSWTALSLELNEAVKAANNTKTSASKAEISAK